MKKVIFYLVLVLFLFPLVHAGSIGISPSRNSFYFEPGLEREMLFKIMHSEPDQRIVAYVSGDLAEYVNLSKTSFIGGGSFIARIKLPKKIDKPGTHRLYIGVREATEEEGNETPMIGGLTAVQSLIEIIVPYPGKYAEASFRIEDVNKGENIPFSLNVYNLGTEDIVLKSKLDVYFGENKIKTKILGEQNIKSKETWSVSDYINGSDMKPGKYTVFLTLDYGKTIIINDTFRVGQFLVNITDYSYRFESKKISPFTVSIENIWNLEIKNVHADVRVINEGEILDSFKTPSEDLSPFETVNLTGFFDASNISEGKYLASIVVFYENKTNFKFVTIYLKDKEVDKIWYVIVGIVFVVVLVIFITYAYLIIKIWRLKRDARKNTKKEG